MKVFFTLLDFIKYNVQIIVPKKLKDEMLRLDFCVWPTTKLNIELAHKENINQAGNFFLCLNSRFKQYPNKTLKTKEKISQNHVRELISPKIKFII